VKPGKYFIVTFFRNMILVKLGMFLVLFVKMTLFFDSGRINLYCFIFFFFFKISPIMNYHEFLLKGWGDKFLKFWHVSRKKCSFCFSSCHVLVISACCSTFFLQNKLTFYCYFCQSSTILSFGFMYVPPLSIGWKLFAKVWCNFKEYAVLCTVAFYSQTVFVILDYSKKTYVCL